MSTSILEPAELRSRGFDALVRSIGWLNAVRFIQQYQPSRLNYTAERDQILPAWNAEEMLDRMCKIDQESEGMR